MDEPNDNQSVVVTIRISREKKETIYRMAKKSEMRPSQFMRMALLLGVAELMDKFQLDSDC